MDKKKVKKKDRKNNGQKKREKRDQKKEADGSERELRVESSRRKEQKTDIPSSLYAPLALSPQREEEEEVRVFARRFLFTFFFRAKKKDANDVEPSRNRASRRESRARGSVLDAK